MSDRPHFAKERKKTALDNRKLNLSAKNSEGKPASLQWGLFSNNPRVTIYTNESTDQDASKNYGKISANLDAPVFFGLLQLLYKVVHHVGEVKYKIENKNYIFPGGKRSEKPVVVSELWVGKDAQGIVWISITARDRPKIKFQFGYGDFHQFLNADGSPLEPGAVSQICALGYIKLLENLMANLLVSEWVEPEPKNPSGNTRGGGGGGGYNNNRNQNNSSEGARPTATSGGQFNEDDDIPF